MDRKLKQQKKIENYNKSLLNPKKFQNSEKDAESTKKTKIGELVSQIEKKVTEKEISFRSKKNRLIEWRKYEDEKEKSLVNSSGKLKFDDEGEYQEIENDKVKKPRVAKDTILDRELDTFDNDFELQLLRKRKKMNDLRPNFF